MDLNEFKNKVIENFCSKLTDKVFFMIQNDRELFKDYLDVVAKSGNLAHVNSEIAKEIKKRFKLRNKDLKNNNPESFLIQSHEEFKTT